MSETERKRVELNRLASLKTLVTSHRVRLSEDVGNGYVDCTAETLARWDSKRAWILDDLRWHRDHYQQQLDWLTSSGHTFYSNGVPNTDWHIDFNRRAVAEYENLIAEFSIQSEETAQ